MADARSQYYTATGDDGTTGLLSARRVPKDHPQPEALGTLDELSAVVGLARAFSQTAEARTWAAQIQRHLYHIMAEIAAAPEHAAQFRQLGTEQVRWLEARIAELEARVPPPRQFILPGESPSGGFWALARTVARRAERRVVTLQQQGILENAALWTYLNRLSSLCFVLELWENQAAGVTTATPQDAP